VGGVCILRMGMGMWGRWGAEGSGRIIDVTMLEVLKAAALRLRIVAFGKVHAFLEDF
jgi:hypothetical protein